MAGLAWIAPGLILLVAAGQPPKAAFRLGYSAGLAHYLISLSWLLRIPAPGAPILGWLALSAFMALNTGLWVWLCWRNFPVPLVAPPGGDTTWPALARRFLVGNWAQRFAWTLFGASLWVAWEMNIARFLGGFPWNPLGASQYRLIPLIQIASFTGVYGLTFLPVWFSLSLLSAGFAIVGRPMLKSAWAAEAILPMATVGAVYVLGYQKVMVPESSHRLLKVALIQPSIPQTIIWDANGARSRLDKLLELSRASLAAHPDLIIWPEGLVPGMPRFQKEISDPITDFCRSNHVWLILGADDAKPAPGAETWDGAEFYNSSFLVDLEGRFATQYKKRRLVIFGEYIPLVRWLPFLKYVTPIQSGFTPGEHAVNFPLKEPRANLSVLICYEDIFADPTREYASDQTDFLVNLTNDGWFGEGAAQWQQAAAAIFRAVENGLPLVRCANNGVTGWADARGRIQSVLETPERGIYGPGWLFIKVPLLDNGTPREPTYYQRYGDRFGWLCVAYALILVLPSRRVVKA